MIEQTRKDKIIGALVSIGIALTAGLLVLKCSQVYPFGSSTLIYSDGQQHTPMLYFIWDVLHGQKSFFFDWDISFGANMMGLISHFGLFSPLNLAYAVIPRDYIPQSISWMFLLRIVLMTLSMRFLLETLYSKLGQPWIIAACCAYSLSAWMFHYAIFSQWVDEAIFLPIMISYLIKLLRSKKGNAGYVCFLAIMLITNFQQSYQTLLFAVLFSGLYIYISREKKERRETILTLGVYTFLAVGLAAVVLLPAAIQIIQSARLSETIFEKLRDIAYTNFQADRYGAEKLLIVRELGLFWALTAGMRVACRIKLGTWKCDRKTDCCFILLALVICPVFVESIHKIWQGGIYASFPLRNGYIISFSTVLCFVQMLHFAAQKLDIARGFRLACKFGIMLGSAALFCFTGIRSISSEQKQPVDLYDDVQQLRAVSAELKGGVLERVKDINTSLFHNSSFISGVPSNSSFLGISSQPDLNENRDMGYGQVCLRLGDSGGTLFSDALYGYKYSVAQDAGAEFYRPVAKIGKLNLYENKYVFPVGFFIQDGNIGDTEGMSPFELQNAISRSMLDCEVLQEKSYPKNIGDRISLNIEKRSLLYFFIPGQVDSPAGPLTVKIEADGEASEMRYVPSIYNTGIACLGVFENETVDLAFIGEIIDDIQIAALDIEALGAAIPRERVTDYSAGKNSISLKVDNPTEDRQTLFLPISNCQGGWTGRINGEQCTVSTVLGHYVGIEVPTGESVIELKYAAPALKLGAAISAICAVLLILALLRPPEALLSNVYLQNAAAAAFNIIFFTFLIMGYGADILIFIGYRIFRLF